jgi:nicotinamide mononucleotide transporter
MITPEVALEWTAVVLNVAFALFIAYGRRIGWLFGFFAGLIGVGLYALAHTWAMSALNGYYVAMALYGWWSWGRGEEQRIRTQPPWRHGVLLVAGLLATWGAAVLLAGVLNGRYPQADAFVTVYSIAATWMMARKWIATWAWFILADGVAVWLNWRIGLPGLRAAERDLPGALRGGPVALGADVGRPARKAGQCLMKGTGLVPGQPTVAAT